MPYTFSVMPRVFREELSSSIFKLIMYVLLSTFDYSELIFFQFNTIKNLQLTRITLIFKWISLNCCFHTASWTYCVNNCNMHSVRDTGETTAHIQSSMACERTRMTSVVCFTITTSYSAAFLTIDSISCLQRSPVSRSDQTHTRTQLLFCGQLELIPLSFVKSES